MIFFSYSAANFLIPLENIYFREIKWQDLAGTQHAYALRTFYSMQQLFRQIAILLLDLRKKLEYCTIASQIFPPRFFCKNSVKLTFLLKKEFTVWKSTLKRYHAQKFSVKPHTKIMLNLLLQMHDVLPLGGIFGSFALNIFWSLVSMLEFIVNNFYLN